LDLFCSTRPRSQHKVGKAFDGMNHKEKLMNVINMNYLAGIRAFANVKDAIKLTMVLLLVCACTTQAAESNRLDQRDTRYYLSPPSAQEIGRHLFPDTVTVRRTRSISFTEPTDQMQLEPSVGMPILFHFGKTTIVEQSRAFLNSVGEMMRSPQYQERTLVVEGHTDAVGTDSYNQRLSELRALAIKDYLVNEFGIHPYRLFPTGRGESILFRPDSPNDGVNRRVEFLPYENR